MSAANAHRSVSSVIALPPYLITTILPCNCLSQGRASASTWAFAWIDTAPVVVMTVGRVLFDVAVRQVGGADGCLAVAHFEVDEDVDVRT